MKKLIVCFLLVAAIARAGDVVNYGPPPTPRPEDVRRSQIQQAIAAKKVLIGMTAAQCEAAWGKPTTINRSIRENSIDEQWVYRNRDAYLYLDNGILTSIQN
jgi:hypothetical protein